MERFDYEAIVVGVSAGGMEALRKIVPILPKKFPMAITIVQHLHPHSDDFLVRDLNNRSQVKVKQAEEKETLRPGMVYMAPSNYHLLIEHDRTFSLCVCDVVNFARPSIDVLFETASEAYHEKLIGIVLTGANKDGSKGAKKIKDRGGLLIVQDPKTADVDTMPLAALMATTADYVLPLEDIGPFLIKLAKSSDKNI